MNFSGEHCFLSFVIKRGLNPSISADINRRLSVRNGLEGEIALLLPRSKPLELTLVIATVFCICAGYGTTNENAGVD